MAKQNMASMADNLSLLLIRLSLGTIFVAHGSQKLLGLFGGHGLTPTLRSFEEKMGIPPVLTLLAIIAEFGGGIGVLLGFLTRISAAGITAVMAVAVWKVHWVNGFFLQPAGGGGPGFEYNLALAALALALVLRGGGAWAVDRFFRWR